MKVGSKRNFTLYNNFFKKTGGGPTPSYPTWPDTVVKDLIPCQFIVDENVVDSNLQGAVSTDILWCFKFIFFIDFLYSF